MASAIEKSFWQKVNKYFVYYENCIEMLKKNKDPECAKKILENMYIYTKQMMAEFYINDKIHQSFNIIKDYIIKCENLMPKDYIIKSNPDFKYGKKTNLKNYDNIEKAIEWVVYRTRRYLNICNGLTLCGPVDFNTLSLTDYCEKSSLEVQKLCNQIGLGCEVLLIHPGFSKSPAIYNGGGYHYMNLITDGEDKYIVDCTYRQFFKSNNNNLERIGILDFSGCKPGVFMLMQNDRKSLAEEILIKGWAKVNDKDIKNYFDGFAIAVRNGLYYQKTNDYSYTTPYTIEDYKNFLSGLDNQFNHEDIETLGFQRTLKPKNN